MTAGFLQLVDHRCCAHSLHRFTLGTALLAILGPSSDLSVYFPTVFLFQRNVLVYVLHFTWQNQLPGWKGVWICVKCLRGGRPTTSIPLSSFIPYGWN